MRWLKKALQGVSHPYLNEYKTRAQKVMNTLFLYYLAGRPGLKPLDVLNSVLEPDPPKLLNKKMKNIMVSSLKNSKKNTQIAVKDGAILSGNRKEDYQSLYDQARRELLEKKLSLIDFI